MARGVLIKLRTFMESSEGWGRDQGRQVLAKLLALVDAHPDASVFRISLEGVERMDVSFASETLVALAKRLRGNKGICILDLQSIDMRENIEAAATRMEQPLMIWMADQGEIIGCEPSPGTRAALNFALTRREVRASEFSDIMGDVSIANASSKFKQLWQQGYLLRCEGAADTGGVEYRYRAIG